MQNSPEVDYFEIFIVAEAKAAEAPPRWYTHASLGDHAHEGSTGVRVLFEGCGETNVAGSL